MGESLRLLIVEDSEDDAFLLLRVLRRSGFEPEWLRVQTAEEMREALGAREWDAIISDYKLPNFSAPAALKVAQQSGTDIAFIVVSGVMLEETAVEVMKAGAHDYIRKENLSRLPEALRREIREAKIRAAHRRAEDELRQSELQHRTILETVMDGFCVIEPATQRLIEVNDMYCRISGYTRAELLQMTIAQLDAHDTPIGVEAYIEKIYQQGGYRFEMRHRRKDGSVFDVEASVQGMPGIDRLVAFMRDITERKQAEAALKQKMDELQQSERALRESEEQYQAFISQSFEGISRTEFDHPIDVTLPVEKQIDAIYANAYRAECNQALAEMYNLPSVKALLGARLVDAHGGKDNPVNRAAFRKFILNGYRSVNDETLEYSSDGRPIWFLSNTVGTIENGLLVRLWGTALIITERKLAEEKARKSMERLSLALDAAKAGSWEWDPRTDANIWSDEFWKVFGLEPNSIPLSYQAWLQLIHPDDRAAVTRVMQGALRKGTEINTEFRVPDHNGNTRTLLTRGRPEHGADGQLERYVGIVLDITERKLAEEAMRDYAHRLVQSQEEERKRLSRDLHDETVQDLVGLAQRAELARADLERSPGAAIRHLEESQALARDMLARMRRLSNDLRPLILEDLGISAAIQSLCDELNDQMPGCAVLCHVSGTERRLDPDVEITAFRIVQQALNNIRAHAPGATCVNVQLDFLADAVSASVQDNGPGFTVIATPVLLRQGHVGVASMQERARLLRGETIITSAPGQGTTISLRLPYGK